MINRMPTPNLDGNSPLKLLRPDYPLFYLSPKVFGFVLSISWVLLERSWVLSLSLLSKQASAFFLGIPPKKKG